MTAYLAIESSCDDTAVAVVCDSFNVLYEQTLSHTQILTQYGGVVPESASREHLKSIPYLVQDLKKNYLLEDISAVAYTCGPGLAGSLLVGSTFAHSLALLLNKPLLPIHHLKGHIYAYLLEEKQPFVDDALGLIVSGGHTMLVKVTPMGDFTVLGQTRDDAVGEVFDKIAKHLSLGFPGGPKVSQRAQNGQDLYRLTKPMVRDKTLDMSFSGLKSQTLRLCQTEEICINSICHSFEKTCSQTLLEKVKLAFELHRAPNFILAGGVAANKRIRHDLQSFCLKKGIHFTTPRPNWCTDNAAMIAAAALYEFNTLKRNVPKDHAFIKSAWDIESK